MLHYIFIKYLLLNTDNNYYIIKHDRDTEMCRISYVTYNRIVHAILFLQRYIDKYKFQFSSISFHCLRKFILT